MSKFIRNTSGSDVDVNGITIPTGGAWVEIPKSNFFKFAFSDELESLVNAGTIEFSNDGVNALSASDSTDLANDLGTASVATVNTVAQELPKIDFSLHFTENSTTKNEWLEHIRNRTSNQTPAVIPFSCKLVSLTFTNSDNDGDTDLEIYRIDEGQGNGSNNTPVFTWQLRNARTAQKSNFSSDILFSPGDKVAVYARDAGTDPDNVIFTLHFQITDFTTSETTEKWSSNISFS